jgi:hypothetical protein
MTIQIILNKLQEILQTLPKVCKKLFDKCASSLGGLREYSSKPVLHEVLLEIRGENPCEQIPIIVHNHIQQLQIIGFQVIVISPQEQIPDEYIARLSYLNEGRLLHQEYLKIEEEHFVRKVLAFHSPDSTGLEMFQPLVNNNPCQVFEACDFDRHYYIFPSPYNPMVKI